jgi:N-acetylmuramoyl-L-alanine amidase
MRIIPVDYGIPVHPMTERDVTKITDLIIHHSAGSLSQTVQNIDAEHRAEGWSEIGYNFVITPDGNIYSGRDTKYVPSAAYGRNAQSVNVCLIGNFQHDDKGYTGPPTNAQLVSLNDLAVHLHHAYPTISTTIAHGDVALKYYASAPGDYATSCCGSELRSKLPALREYVLAHAKK